RLAPSVFVFPPPLEELSSSRRSLSLTCLARGFFPENLDLHWQKNQEPIPVTSGDVTSVQTG
ncbi:IGHM protein, partial [Oenanthe oenanthe]|nr:IGHM protein [Oenanthe oenanthe]